MYKDNMMDYLLRIILHWLPPWAMVKKTTLVWLEVGLYTMDVTW